MSPSDAIAKYDEKCAECRQYENEKARSTICPFCLIEVGRNASIIEKQISLNGGVTHETL